MRYDDNGKPIPYCVADSHVFVIDAASGLADVCSCGLVSFVEPAGKCGHGFGPDHPCVGCTIELGIYKWQGMRDRYGKRD